MMKNSRIPTLLIDYILILLASFFLWSCKPGNSPSTIPTSIYPDSSSPVQVTVLSSDQFAINNHTALPIYYQIFPTDLLPFIDWSPCESDATCQLIQILPFQSLTFLFDSVAGPDTQSLTLFWWQRESNNGQHIPEHLFPQVLTFPIP